MGKAVILLVILFVLSQMIFGFFEKRHKWFSRPLMNKLFWYHMLFWGIYMIYTSYNWSDSIRYFRVPGNPDFIWSEYYGTGTTFIYYITYPFVNFLNFNFEMAMMFFAWIGFLGFLFTYLFFRENIPVKVKLFNRWDLLTILLFLPNMHFWTAALAKGGVIFPGIMMFIYALNNPKKRWMLLILGSLLTYHVRPHIFLFLVVGAGFGYMSGSKHISMAKKVGAFISMLVLVIIIRDQVLAVVNIQETDDVINDLQDFTANRSDALSVEAGSGVDMSNYPLPFQLFTFWFRPLFIDAPNLLGIVVSFENLLYLILTAKIIKKDFISFMRKAPPIVKTSLVIFFMTSLAMTFVMSNLGIIMRQKSMVMYFLFFVIYYYLGHKKYVRILKVRRRREKLATE